MTETLSVELNAPGLDPLTIEWDAGAIASGAEAGTDGDPPWTLAGPLDWEALETLRVLSARFEDGSLLAVAAVRPAGAAGHGDELVGAVLKPRRGAAAPLAEVLLSTEYGPDGLARRIGLELYPSADEVPKRAAGEAREALAGRHDGARREVTTLEMSMEGTSGHGRYEILRSA